MSEAEDSAAGGATGAAHRPLRVLIVTKEFDPQPRSGGSIRTLALATALARSHEVRVVCPAGTYEVGAGQEAGAAPRVALWRAASRGGGPFAAVAAVASLARYRTIGGARTCGPALIAALRSAGSGAGADVVVLDHTCLVGIRGLLPPGVPRIVSMHNVESDLMRQRVGAEPGARRLAAALEHRLLRRVEAASTDLPLIVCTPDDAASFRAVGYDDVVVARNGVDPPASHRAATRAALRDHAGAAAGDQDGATLGAELLFTGALDWGPNVSGVLWLVRSDAWARLVRERPEVSLTVAGRRPSPAFLAAMAQAPATTVLADVPSMQPLFDRARLGIAPLLEGGGSRIKLLEYAGSALPSVATAVGASGLDELPPGAVRITGDDPEEFCDGIRAALDGDPDVLSPDTVRAVLDRYSWTAALAPASALVARVAGRAAGHARAAT